MTNRRPAIAALTALAVAAATATATAQAQPAPRFTIDTLPPLGGASSQVSAVNDAGQVVGSAKDSLGRDKAIVWQRGQSLVVLPGPAAQVSSANAISERGQVAGSLNTAAGQRPYLWTPGGTVQQLPTLFDVAASASGVNDSAQVVGTASAGNSKPSRWSQATGVVALPMGSESGSVLAINNNGQAVGQFGIEVGSSSYSTPVTWSASNVRTQLMSTVEGQFGVATAINDLGQVAGQYSRPDQFDGTRPFTWAAGVGLRFLQSNGGNLRTMGNNDAGLVVGTLDSPGPNDRAMVWRPDGALVDLVTLTGAPFRVAKDVNNHAQIVANSISRGHLLTLHPDWTGGDGNWADSTGTRWNFAGLGAVGVVGAPHEVLINPGISATVRGAALGQALSLRVGGTAGQVVVLDLNGGTTTVATGTTLDSGGVLRGNGRHQGDVSVASLGRIEVGSGQTLQLAGSLTHAGLVDVRAGSGVARLEVTGDWDARGQTHLLNAELRVQGGLVNQNNLSISGFSQVLGDVDNRRSGRILVSGVASEALFWNTLVNNGSVNVTTGSTAAFFGAVTGAGSFAGGGTKHFAGGYSPGNSPGLVTLEGNVVFDGGILLMELAGLAAGTGHDKLVFNDASVWLGSGLTLKVVLLDGYVPALGDRFDLFDWNGSLGAASGAFADLLLPTLSGEWVWDTSRIYLDGDLSVIAVPEPQTWGLMALGLAGVLLWQRRAERRLCNELCNELC